MHEKLNQIKPETLILTKSSMISLSADTHRINIRGTSVVYRPVGEMSGICCTNADIVHNQHIVLITTALQ